MDEWTRDEITVWLEEDQITEAQRTRWLSLGWITLVDTVFSDEGTPLEEHWAITPAWMPGENAF